MVKPDGTPTQPDDVVVRTGSVDMRKGDLRKVAQVIVHEDYNPQKIDNDVALLRLAEPVTQSSGPVGAISIAPQGAQVPGGPAVVIGWGMMEDGKFPIQLKETDIDIVSNDTCNKGMAEQTKRDVGGFLLGVGQANGIPMENLEQAFQILTREIGPVLSNGMICAGTPSGQ